MKQLLDITESIDSQSQSMIIPETVTPSVKPLPEEEEEEEAPVKDEVKAGREQFLKIYKEKGPTEEEKEQDTGPKEIKFRREEPTDMESETGQKIKISKEDGTGKPLIQEIKSISEDNTTTDTNEEKPHVEPLPSFYPFNWETAIKVEGVHQFFHTKEFVFVNMPMKGYSKICDVHYALSQNELFIEVKDPATLKVHRICKTLLKEISVDQSSVELLVDFIAVKLRKEDKEQAWDQLGYDIKEFTIPKRG